MTHAAEIIEIPAAASPRRERVFMWINRLARPLDALGFGWAVPVIRLIAGDSPSEQLGELRRVLLVPLLGIAIFLGAWSVLAPKVVTSLGAVPGPAQVWEQAI